MTGPEAESAEMRGRVAYAARFAWLRNRTRALVECAIAPFLTPAPKRRPLTLSPLVRWLTRPLRDRSWRRRLERRELARTFVESAICCGQLAPAHRDWAVLLAAVDLEMFLDWLEDPRGPVAPISLAALRARSADELKLN